MHKIIFSHVHLVEVEVAVSYCRLQKQVCPNCRQSSAQELMTTKAAISETEAVNSHQGSPLSVQSQ